jgi:ABC-type Fe3+ transport system substrate-binding protein
MRIWTGIVFVCVALLPYVAMLRSGPEQKAGPAAVGPIETLAVVSPHRREVRLEYGRAFTDYMRRTQNREVSITWIDVGGTSKILKDLESRFATNPDRPGVDVLFGGGVAPYLTALSQQWLQPVALTPGLLDGIPAQVAGGPVYDPQGAWFGVALSGFGILYNRPIVARMGLPVPVGWEDLARPEYFSWVASGDPRSSGSVHMCYEIILQAYGFERGWSLLTRICANVRNFGEAGGTGPREVAAGEVAAAMVIDQYAKTVIDSVGDDLLVFVLPDRTTVIGPDPIALIRNSEKAELGREFIEFALSDEGQRLLFQPAGRKGQLYSLYRMPVREALFADPDAPKPNPYRYTGEGFVYDTKAAGRHWDLVNDLMGVWLIEAQGDLRRAWQAVIERGMSPDEVEVLCRPPVTEAEMKRLADEWKDSRVRLRVMREWSDAARLRYRRVADGPTGEGKG